VVTEVNKGIESNLLATSVTSFQRFFIQELCDVYIEFSKPVLYGNRLDSAADVASSEDQRALQRQSAQATLHRCLDYSMRLLHPFTPFVTEELWCVWQLSQVGGKALHGPLTCACQLQAAHPSGGPAGQQRAGRDVHLVCVVPGGVRDASVGGRGRRAAHDGMVLSLCVAGFIAKLMVHAL